MCKRVAPNGGDRTVAVFLISFFCGDGKRGTERESTNEKVVVVIYRFNSCWHEWYYVWTWNVHVQGVDWRAHCANLWHVAKLVAQYWRWFFCGVPFRSRLKTVMRYRTADHCWNNFSFEKKKWVWVDYCQYRVDNWEAAHSIVQKTTTYMIGFSNSLTIIVMPDTIELSDLFVSTKSNNSSVVVSSSRIWISGSFWSLDPSTYAALE